MCINKKRTEDNMLNKIENTYTKDSIMVKNFSIKAKYGL